MGYALSLCHELVLAGLLLCCMVESSQILQTKSGLISFVSSYILILAVEILRMLVSRISRLDRLRSLCGSRRQLKMLYLHMQHTGCGYDLHSTPLKAFVLLTSLLVMHHTLTAGFFLLCFLLSVSAAPTPTKSQSADDGPELFRGKSCLQV